MKKWRHVLIFVLALALVLGPTPRSASSAYAITEADRKLLGKIQKDTLQFFLVHTDPKTGLTLDSSRPGSPASIAATGFALASFGIAVSHGWLSHGDAYHRIERTVKTLENNNTHRKGFFYHFLDPKTGRRAWNSEVSSIDTALLIAGLMIAVSYFPGTDLEVRAQKLYDRIDWNWMLNGSLLFSHGWRPKQGFLPYYWDMYSEHLILQALAFGSETHPIPAKVWNEWARTKDMYNEKEIIYSFTGSLFTYQYAHAFIDFRNLNDQGINYFENSRRASDANQEFCSANAAEYKTYETGAWGLTACLGPDGYKAYGAQPGNALHDGTVAMYGVIGSIIFTPAASIKTIRDIHERHGEKIYGEFGFKGAFNVDQDWWADEYLGIDQGISVLMLENFLNDGAVWKRFMKLPEINRWISRAGLEQT